ncbi:site-specific DNA-methyltransferase [Vibrio parahaemolyticus]|nr:site-specific DNA-methyltransferase [Vibrio parahaemolyticus]
MSNDQTNVENYEFEPIKGYPMLNWKGKRPFRSTQYFPAQLKEVYGQEDDNGWINKIFWGDNLQVMSHLLKEFRGKVDLVYIDPPFDSKAEYKKTIKLRKKTATSDKSSFEEKQYTDLWNNDDYLQFMYERLCLIRELMSDNSTVYVHCDWHRNSAIRLILDEIFGPEQCHNTISWKRSHAQGNSGQGAKHFGRVTDTILIYSKGSPTWNSQYLPYDEATVARDYKHIDPVSGERYRLMPVDGPGGAAKGNPYYEFLGVSGYWRYAEKTMQELYEKGEIILSSTGRSLSRKRYLKDAKGTPITDWWDDVSRISPTSTERLDYPTQKPEALIERIISTSSNEGDIVFDCFMGSGTTQAVASKLNRKFIGADINLGSIQTTTKRLATSNVSFEVYNVNNYEIFRNPVEAKELLIEALEIQPLGSSTIYDGEKDGFKVKIMPVNRIATKEDLNDLIQGFPYKQFEERKEANPNQPVEEIMLVCMGHEPGLGAILENESGYKMKVEVVDILRDKSDLTFKYDSEASIKIKDGKLVIEEFYPRNLLQKLSQQKDNVTEWREMVESIMIDWNYDGAVMEPSVIDIPAKDDFVAGEYEIPEGANNIKVKITDLLSESYEEVIAHG